MYQTCFVSLCTRTISVILTSFKIKYAMADLNNIYKFYGTMQYTKCIYEKHNTCRRIGGQTDTLKDRMHNPFYFLLGDVKKLLRVITFSRNECIKVFCAALFIIDGLYMRRKVYCNVIQ